MRVQKHIVEKGAYLLSQPFLHDPDFFRAVVLLTEHNDIGSVGFILNKPTPYHLNDLIEGFSSVEIPIFKGGPVQQDRIYYLHRSEALKLESEEVLPNVFWGGDFEKVRFLLRNNALDLSEIRFFLGYSGWESGQLNTEMSEKSWIAAKTDCSPVFSHNQPKLWQSVLKMMGKKYEMIANYPADPAFN